MRNPDRETVFRFKQFDVSNCLSAMKVGTDGVLLGAWAFASESEGERSDIPYNIMDIGCGTGVISLIMAQRFHRAKVIGIDIDCDAATEASLNFKNSPWPDRLTAECIDFTLIDCDNDSTRSDKSEMPAPQRVGKMDLLISNPPYFSNGALSSDSARNLARHDNSLSVERLLSQSAKLMSEGSKLAVILPIEQLDTWKFQTVLNGLTLTRLCIVSTTPAKAPRRFMSEVCMPTANPQTPQGSCLESRLCIHLASGEYSPEYRRLVEPFYTKL